MKRYGVIITNLSNYNSISTYYKRVIDQKIKMGKNNLDLKYIEKDEILTKNLDIELYCNSVRSKLRNLCLRISGSEQWRPLLESSNANKVLRLNNKLKLERRESLIQSQLKYDLIKLKRNRKSRINGRNLDVFENIIKDKINRIHDFGYDPIEISEICTENDRIQGENKNFMIQCERELNLSNGEINEVSNQDYFDIDSIIPKIESEFMICYDKKAQEGRILEDQSEFYKYFPNNEKQKNMFGKSNKENTLNSTSNSIGNKIIYKQHSRTKFKLKKTKTKKSNSKHKTIKQTIRLDSN